MKGEMEFDFGFSEYQLRARETAIYPGQNTILGLLYCGLGTAGEAGEVANKIKKVLRDNNCIVDGVHRERIKKELGGVLWYLAMTCDELGLSLSDVAYTNIQELASRKERGTLHGDGDNR